MKILFVCGSIEPGRDGVGDYTMKLAAELSRQGNLCSVVAINDCHVLTEFSGYYNIDSIKMPVLRLPTKWPNKQRYHSASVWIEKQDPDWVSLQFVIYAFRPNGLPFGISTEMNKMLAGRKLHIMFHELWIGIERSRLIKTFITSTVQKGIIKHLLTTIKPSIIHTSLPYFQQRLADLGHHGKLLQVFSNIDRYEKNNKSENSCLFRIGIFSQIEIYSSVVLFLRALKEQADTSGIKFEIFLLGGIEAHMKAKAIQLREQLGDGYNVLVTGYLAPPALSKALHSCTLGLTSVPRHCLGKSGSVAAFIAHGIPVAAPHFLTNQGPYKIGFSSSNLCNAIILEPALEHIYLLKKNILHTANMIEVPAVAKKFISDLKEQYESRTRHSDNHQFIQSIVPAKRIG
ncbi:glycosyltransferase [Pontibacter virosus]|uniref:Glycosyltransferase involved in cell wall biosynthesis n=1 Tax=Pontibacter virosus TaxID=1765052 RepID=A0A2U1AQM8_9BACT|nr:glycosyltransferase [Pontibacter virosus]PVY38678.1 glycosyltransferase involved in cell wall biosynthesis [Pontibacter virosus]